MLASYHNQENVVHSHHHAPTKQQPKTPGSRYPKTPGNFGRNDENGATVFGGKSALGGAKLGENRLTIGKMTGQRRAMVTPLDNRARAPLGNKTTNAKARTGQTVGVKDMVRDIEKSQTKQTGGQKSRQKQLALQPAKLNVQSDEQESVDTHGVPEPEYAPPTSIPLPYESDVLPPGGLTFNGLKKENLLRGYYQHFHNSVDENGVSRMERRFKKEMETVLQQAEARNAQEIEAINWSTEDYEDNQVGNVRADSMAKAPTRPSFKKPDPAGPQRQPGTLAARRAASVLAVRSDKQNQNVARPASSSSTTRRPLSSIITGTKPARPLVTKPSSVGNLTGEAASRTTLGYNKGRSASSMVHSRGSSQSIRQRQQPKHTADRDFDSELTITPARMRQVTSSRPESVQPQFMSIFDDGDDDGDLPPMQKPFPLSDDEEEEFELKLTI